MDTPTPPEFTVLIQGPHHPAKALLTEYITRQLWMWMNRQERSADWLMAQENLYDQLREHSMQGMRVHVAEQTVLTSMDMSPAIQAALAELVREDPELTKKKAILIESLPLILRTRNCFRAEGIKTVGEVMKLTQHDLLKIPNLGRKSLTEFLEVLETLDVRIPHR